ncbi:hypothetical protein [Pararhizobium gei]|uniref:hypothetical protein n=1 Tax=Pararhizobium gei TaxID=1395951 RepID=UPI0023DC3B90|nr:hypothetical protein [Rhizobium gei]
MEKPIFDVANDNAEFDFRLPNEIPANKQEARSFLTEAMSATSVAITVVKPTERPVQRAWKPSPKPANDNREPVSWPFLDKLRRDGQHEDAQMIEHYRGLVAIMEANPLQGQDPTTAADGIEVEQRSTVTDKDIDKAAENEWPDDQVAGGDLIRKGTRQLSKFAGSSGQAKQAGEKTVVRMRCMGVRFNERVLIAQIDLREVLPRLQRAMGPLVAPFEDAVLGGLTMGEIGEARSFKGKQAESAGKALVYAALDAVREEWGSIKAEQRAAEAQADRNVERRRAELAADQARFLGRAA